MKTLPPQPSGLSPTLVVAREVPVSQRIVAALVVAAMFAGLAAFLVARGLGVVISCAIFAVAYAIVIAASFSAQLTAGRGWLARGKSRYVRIDRLVSIASRVTIAGTRLTLRDQDGNVIRVVLADLRSDPVLWSLVGDGVATSLANGLQLDTRTQAIFR